MFLHLGADQEVLASKIVSIINISTIENSEITAEFIKKIDAQQDIIYITKDQHKSIIMVTENDKTILYYSPISCHTLENRLILMEKNVFY